MCDTEWLLNTLQKWGIKYLRDFLFRQKSEKTWDYILQFWYIASVMTKLLVPNENDIPSGFKPPCPPASVSGSASVYLQALCLDSPGKHWELLKQGRPFGFHVPNSLWLKCPSSSSLELIKDKSAWVTQTMRRTETAARCAGGQRQKQPFIYKYQRWWLMVCWGYLVYFSRKDINHGVDCTAWPTTRFRSYKWVEEG